MITKQRSRVTRFPIHSGWLSSIVGTPGEIVTASAQTHHCMMTIAVANLAPTPLSLASDTLSNYNLVSSAFALQRLLLSILAEITGNPKMS